MTITPSLQPGKFISLSTGQFDHFESIPHQVLFICNLDICSVIPVGRDCNKWARVINMKIVISFPVQLLGVGELFTLGTLGTCGDKFWKGKEEKRERMKTGMRKGKGEKGRDKRERGKGKKRKGKKGKRKKKRERRGIRVEKGSENLKLLSRGLFKKLLKTTSICFGSTKIEFLWGNFLPSPRRPL